LESLKDSSLNEQLSIVLIGHPDEKVTEMAIAASLLSMSASDLNDAYHFRGMRTAIFAVDQMRLRTAPATPFA
jgi:hypothetical protein